MIIYLIGLLLMIICAVLPLIINKKTKIITAICVVVPLLFMWILCSFKGNNIGSDTGVYIESYSKASDPSEIKISRDIGYGVFEFICSKAHLPWRAFLCLANLPLFIGTGIFAYKKTSHPSFMPFFIYTFLLFEFALSGIRQSIAIGFLLIGMSFFNRKKWATWIVYYALNILAVLFHKSSFVMFAFPVLCLISLSKNSLFYTSLSLTLAVLFMSQIEQFFYYGTSILEYYPNNQSTNFTFVFVLLISIAIPTTILFFPKQIDCLNSYIESKKDKMSFIYSHIFDESISASANQTALVENYFSILPLLIFLIIGLYSNTSVRGYYYAVGSFGAVISYFIFSQKSKLLRIILLSAVLFIFSLYFGLSFLRRSNCVPYSFF